MQKRLVNFLFIALLAGLVFFLVLLVYIYMAKSKSINTLKKQEDVILKVTDDKNKDISSDKILVLKEYYANDDVVGILSIPNMGINAVLTKGKDNDYYLKHNVYGKSDIYGNIFVDYRVNILNSKQINIYGHSDKDKDIPFARLDGYLSYDTYLNNKYHNA